MQALGSTWVQIDEPILVLDLPIEWLSAFPSVYQSLEKEQINLLLTTYFGGLEENARILVDTPAAGFHLDVVHAPEQLSSALELINSSQILSLGIVDGRNIWKADVKKIISTLSPLHNELHDRLWISGSSSFLHCPVDLDKENHLDKELLQWLAFAKQKTEELVIVAKGLNEGTEQVAEYLNNNTRALENKKNSARVTNPKVQHACEQAVKLNCERTPFTQRKKLQDQQLNLPLLPTTTIGSFPQTQEIRTLRKDLKNGTLSNDAYEEKMRAEIKNVIQQQTLIGLDVLVHGEPERNDMVEYFGEQLDGFAFTGHGWVQSYGSRCVKPPIIYGDVSRAKPMTTFWTGYAQSLSTKPVKGMLTGPITIVMWSFVRNDQTKYQTMKQVALALRDEVKDLEHIGIKVIQIDEPAFREGLPLRQNKKDEYLQEAIHAFKLTASCVDDHTQIHSHMCYSEFNDIISSIAALDADVISIEASRSNMELLQAFEDFSYPNDIGPGVYDIHSPRIPSEAEMVELIDKASCLIPIERLWVNPDCGLKTRQWPEVVTALKNMVAAAKTLRKKYNK